MLTEEAIAFAELGKLAREFNFAEEQAVTDPEVLAYVNGIVRSMISGRNLSVVGVTVDGDTFKGEARVKVSPRLTKRFGFEISPDSKSFEALNADDIEKFAEPVEFKAGSKTLKCKVEQCGGRCLKGGEKCRLTMKPEERKAHDKALRKVGTVETSLAKKRREMKEARAKEAATPKTDKKAGVTSRTKEKSGTGREAKADKKKEEKKSLTPTERKAKELEDLKQEKHESLDKLWERSTRLSGDRKDAFGEAVDKHLSLKAESKDKEWLDTVESQANSMWNAAGQSPAIPETARERFARFVGDAETREIISAKRGEISDDTIQRTFGEENPVSRASLQASSQPEKMGATGKIVEEWAKGLGQTAWNKATPAQKAEILERLGVDGIKDLGIEFKAQKKTDNSPPFKKEHITFPEKIQKDLFLRSTDKAADHLVKDYGFPSKEIAKKAINGTMSYTSSKYSSIKSADRGDNSDKSAKEAAEGVNEYLKRMPRYDGEVHRGMYFLNENFNENAIEASLAKGTDSITSFTTNKKIAEKFSTGNNGISRRDVEVFITVQNKTGVSIKSISLKPNEDEVTVPKGVRYQIVGKSKTIKDVDDIFAGDEPRKVTRIEYRLEEL
jgi:hypothetical protein